MSLIGKSIGNYRVTRKLGEGGMGEVYLGEHPLIGKKVAIKVLHDELSSKEEATSRFFQEAKSVNDIGHENIVDILDFGKAPRDPAMGGGDEVYLIMEYLEGESLASRRNRGPLPYPELVHVMRQCASALAASHAKEIIHRDLKPENIFLVTHGGDSSFAKILDFGIAKLTGAGRVSQKTRVGLVIGTPAYMSPEQCEGKADVDARSDVYALGVVMYELLTGRVPYEGEGFREVMVAHLTREAVRPTLIDPHIPPELEAIALHAIEKDRARRFQSMAELEAALTNPGEHYTRYRPKPVSGERPPATLVLESPPMRATPMTPAPASQPSLEAMVPRRRAGVWMAAGAALCLGVVGVVAMRRDDSPPVPSTPQIAPDPNIAVVIESAPPGAEVMRAGKSLGKTPLTLTVRRGEPAFPVELTLAGHLAQTLEVPTDSARTLFYGLRPQAPPVVEQPAPPDPVKPPVEKKKPVPKKKNADGPLMEPSF
jgi:serine/threonine protein kinase